MSLSKNEIKTRAQAFASKWQGEASEKAESQSFWNGFFHIFGVARRRFASFEKNVEKCGGKTGFIDLFWRGTLIVEHKSKGGDLEKAYAQATDYFPGLKDTELPR